MSAHNSHNEGAYSVTQSEPVRLNNWERLCFSEVETEYLHLYKSSVPKRFSLD